MTDIQTYDVGDVSALTPWADLMISPFAERLPTKSFMCFSRFVRGEDSFDDGGALPVYERAAFWAYEPAAAMRKAMRALRACPAVITFEEV